MKKAELWNVTNLSICQTIQVIEKQKLQIKNSLDIFSAYHKVFSIQRNIFK